MCSSGSSIPSLCDALCLLVPTNSRSHAPVMFDGQKICQRWSSGFGCDRDRCHNVHVGSHNILNECHRYQRGQPCHTNPCYRLHVPPGASASSSAAPPPPPPWHAPPRQAPQPPTDPDAVLAAVKEILAAFPQDAQCREAKKLLLRFHDDRNPEPELQQVFRNTVHFLTDIVNGSR